MNLFILLPIICVPRILSDPCTKLHPDSFCLNSGECSGPLRSRSCVDVYVSLSEGMLRPLEEPPHMPTISSHYSLFAIEIANQKRNGFKPVLPMSASANPHHTMLMNQIAALAAQLGSQYPYLLAPLDNLRELVTAAERVARTLLNPWILKMIFNHLLFMVVFSC